MCRAYPQTLLTLLTILLGGIFFSEFKRMGVFSMLVFAMGVGVALAGFCIHTSHRAQTSHEEPAAPPISGDASAANGSGVGLTAAQTPGSVGRRAGTGGSLSAAEAGASPSPQQRVGETSRLLGS